MDQLERFYEAVKEDMIVTLATSGADGVVSMRAVSPVYHEGGILMFTNAGSRKFRQLKENARCCVSARGFFAEAEAEFCGPTMRPENEALRNAYCGKFPGAFDEGMAFGGRDDDFILLHPTRLTGWAFPNDEPTPEGVPTVPFEIIIG